MSSTVSQGRLVRDGRRLPFFVVTKAATAVIRHSFDAKRRTTALAIYATLVEQANDEGSDTFEAARGRIAAAAGVHASTLTRFANLLEEAGLLTIQRRKAGSANLPNLWTLADPPLLASDDEGSPGATPPRLRRGPSSPESTDLLASDEDPSSPQTRVFKEPSEEQEPAANAAAASADAPDGSNDAAGSSSKNDEKIREHWGNVTAYLKAYGFDRATLIEAAPRLKALCRRRVNDLADIDWPGVTALMLDAKGTPALYADQPAGVLAWALGQRGAEAKRSTAAAAPPNIKPPAGAAPKIVVDPDSEIVLAWDRVLQDARKHIDGDAWDTWLSVIVPVDVSEGELRIAVPSHARSWIDHGLSPLLAASTTRVIDKHVTKVRILPRDQVILSDQQTESSA
ncbi:MAG: hypothetical protein ITG02_01100 [Patulibacter sp.]|nr:hypothetical protein [Patulibacter sp.]